MKIDIPPDLVAIVLWDDLEVILSTSFLFKYCLLKTNSDKEAKINDVKRRVIFIRVNI